MAQTAWKGTKGRGRLDARNSTTSVVLRGFDGDGRSDIPWRHAPLAGTGVTGLQVRTMQGLTVAQAGALAYVPDEWHMA